MTHAKVCVISLSFLLVAGGAAYAGALEKAQDDVAQANDAYYQSIRYKSLTPAQRNERYDTLVAPKQQVLAQTVQFELERNLSAQGVERGEVKDTGDQVDYTPPDTGKHASPAVRKKIRAELGADQADKSGAAYANKKKGSDEDDSAPAVEPTVVSTDPVNVEEVVFESKSGKARKPAAQVPSPKK